MNVDDKIYGKLKIIHDGEEHTIFIVNDGYRFYAQEPTYVEDNHLWDWDNLHWETFMEYKHDDAFFSHKYANAFMSGLLAPYPQELISIKKSFNNRH